MKAIQTFKALAASAALAATLASAPVLAQAADDQPVVNQARDFSELLRNIEQRRVVESRDNARREQEFRSDRNQQRKLLQDAQAERRREEQRSERLETEFEENERSIGELTAQLDDRLGSLRELFGVLQQVAGDTRGSIESSYSSLESDGSDAQWLGELAAKMGTATQLATIEEINRLQSILANEIVASGEIKTTEQTVTSLSGEQRTVPVTRIGNFAVVSDGEYLTYDGLGSGIIDLARQPESRFTGTISDFEEAPAGELVGLAVDPTRGQLLKVLVDAATWGDRIGSLGGEEGCRMPFCDGDGGPMGSAILILGFIGLLLSIERLVALFLMGSKVNSQKKSDTASDGNPLGRVLGIYQSNKDVDVETLELKLGEAILGETPKITRNVTIIQVISIVAPLMGLLGTVIGMIQTFQAITLFGTGDPKTMAGGISTALMTTVLGLVVAIPMTLFHAIIAARSKSIIHVLEEQSAGIIADHAERTGQALE